MGKVLTRLGILLGSLLAFLQGLFHDALLRLGDVLTFLNYLLGYNYGYASVLEILWTSVALVGFIFTSWYTLQCYYDLRALKRASNFVQDGARNIIAHSNLRSSYICLFLFLVFIWAGITGMGTPPAHYNQPPTPYALVLGMGFIIASLAMSLGAVLNHRDRRRLIHVMRTRRVIPLQGELDAESERLDTEAQRLKRRAEHLEERTKQP